MSTKPTKADTRFVGFKLPSDVFARLELLAQEEQRSRSFLIVKAIEQLLKRNKR